MAKTGGFSNPKPNLKGGVCCTTGSLGAKGHRMNEKQGKGGLAGQAVGQTSTSTGSAASKMDNRGGKGLVGKSVGTTSTSCGGTTIRMNIQGKGN